ncbi:SpoIIE family protein phosphatase [Candidatus Dojkabacteria bacterium]|nr:SpoIIE family protein phosphatase [Candidatus Dojkabacteria bacterium]
MMMKNNQDRVFTYEHENGTKIIAVADGSDDGDGAFAADCLVNTVKDTIRQSQISKPGIEYHQGIRNQALESLADEEYNADKMAFCAYNVARIFSDGLMEMSYLGDVMLAVFRAREVVYQSTEHSDPETQWLTKGLKVVDKIGQNLPEFTEIAYDTLQLESGDLIICASDGLWDNRRPEEIAQMIEPASNVGTVKEILSTIPHDRKSYRDDRGIAIYKHS